MTQPPDNNLHDWLDETVGETPDPIEGTQQVMSQIEETPQAGRWLPFPLFRRKAHAATTKYQPGPIPVTNAHSPTVLGRTQSMFSPVNAIAAGALVFAIGGAFLIAQPFDQQGGSVPGAETEDVAATWVTGTVERAPSCSGSEIEADVGVIRSRNVECSPQTWTSSDPRLTGEVSRWWNEDTYLTDEGSITVSMDAAYLRNEGGGWACSASDLAKGVGSTSGEVTGTTHTCIGDGGYEGLSALLASEQGLNYSEEFVGLIFSGDFPPLPGPPAAE